MHCSQGHQSSASALLYAGKVTCRREAPGGSLTKGLLHDLHLYECLGYYRYEATERIGPHHDLNYTTCSIKSAQLSGPLVRHLRLGKNLSLLRLLQSDGFHATNETRLPSECSWISVGSPASFLASNTSIFFLWSIELLVIGKNITAEHCTTGGVV